MTLLTGAGSAAHPVVDPVRVVSLLHVEPQMVEEQTSSLLSISGFPSRLSKCPRSSSRTSTLVSRTEQLADVPTILYFFKRIVDIPVPRRREERLETARGRDT